jgi:hypothetical protein
MLKMAVYIIISVFFGFLMGKLYSNAKNREDNIEKDDKYNKIISDKNGIIIKQKNNIRAMERKLDGATQGYELQLKLYEKLESKNRQLKDENSDVLHLQNENRTLSSSLSDKVKLIDEKDQIITLLEGKIKKENA